MIAEMIYTRSGNVIVKTPFIADFINDLKRTVPKRHRLWDASEKVWYVDEAYADDVAELVHCFFPDADQIDLARAALVKRTPEPPHWAKVLYVYQNAPVEVVEAAYRALAKKHHPDRGGNEKAMKELNEAIEQARLMVV